MWRRLASPALRRVSTAGVVSSSSRFMRAATPSGPTPPTAAAAALHTHAPPSHAASHKRPLSPVARADSAVSEPASKKLQVAADSLPPAQQHQPTASSAPTGATFAVAAPPSPAPVVFCPPPPLIPVLSIDMSSAPISQASPVLVLTDLESRIFGHVLAACDKFQLRTQVRVAGGWVRDKLLGLESEDIDFALDNMSGEEFAAKLAEHMKAIGEKTSSVGVIKVNPEQSKHLATATMKILDVSIDINNFREEIYHAGSRIPEITLSTAKEDALRRDFTVNSLFYNIHTKQVEDYVGGLDDLRAGLLRTPRDPFKTFSDDPLRILRAARFAGRFGYRVDEAVAAAASTPAIQADLATKVSRERMGIECHKMLQTYKASYLSFHLLTSAWKLRRIVFEVPEKFEPAPASEIGDSELIKIEPRGVPTDDAFVTGLCLKGMQLADAEIRAHPSAYTPDEASSLLLAAFLVPYYGYRTEVKKGRFNTVVWHVVRESLRLPQREAQLASDLLAHAHQLIRASFLHHEATTPAAAAGSARSHAASSSGPLLSPLERLQIVTGGVLRLTGSHSRVAICLADIILQTVPQKLGPSAAATFDASLDLASMPPAVDPLDLRPQFAAYRRWLESTSGLLDLPVWEMKPIASGTEVCAVLGISAKGPHVGAIINKMVEWQMMHVEQMVPLVRAPTTTAADASSSAAAAHVPDAAALAQAKEVCFVWLKAQNLATTAPELRAKGKQHG